MEEQEKSPEKELNKMNKIKAAEIPDAEFKTWL